MTSEEYEEKIAELKSKITELERDNLDLLDTVWEAEKRIKALLRLICLPIMWVSGFTLFGFGLVISVESPSAELLVALSVMRSLNHQAQ